MKMKASSVNPYGGWVSGGWLSVSHPALAQCHSLTPAASSPQSTQERMAEGRGLYVHMDLYSYLYFCL